MVFITLSPYVLRRVLLLVAAALILSAISCFARPIFVAVPVTPYDEQMAPVRLVLTTETITHQTPSLALVNEWIAELRRIPYEFCAEWKTPTAVASASTADCKGKAVALYQRMRLNGVSDLRLVIGRRAPASRLTHTWIEWSFGAKKYVLDPTFNCRAQSVATIPEDCYVAHYAYSGTRKYRAISDTRLYVRL